MYILRIETIFNLCNFTGWQWIHVNVQSSLVRSAGHAENRKDPQPEDRVVSSLVC